MVDVGEARTTGGLDDPVRAGARMEALRRATPSAGATSADTVLRATEALRVALRADDARLEPDLEGVAGSMTPRDGLSLVRAPGHVLRVPLGKSDLLLGWVVASRRGEPFTSEDREVAARFAADLAEALQGHGPPRREKARGAADERRRLAQELHESVTQTLYAVSMMAETLPDVIDSDAVLARSAAVRLRQLVLSALGELRAFMLERQPEHAEGIPLAELLRSTVSSVTNRFGITFATNLIVESSGDDRTDADLRVAVSRAVRELLSNVAKHARASAVTIRLLHTSEGGGTVTVDDDGVGFSPDLVDSVHLGLVLMKADLADARASLTMESQSGRGTRATISWPSLR